MTESANPNASSDVSISHGRYKVGQVITLLIGFDLITTAFYLVTVSSDRLPQQVGRAVLGALLCLALYRGARWARWLLVVLAVLAGMVIAPHALRVLDGDTSAGTLMLALMFVGYIWLARILIWVPEVPMFLAAQREKYK